MAESGAQSTTIQTIKENCTAIDGLRHAQTYTARFLQLSFLAATKHPDISKLIRLTAHSAQRQHSLALGCMVKCSANSKYVVRTLLPMIVEGIDNEIPELITGALDDIKTTADQMYSEAKETVDRYEKIQGDVQGQIADIKTKKEELEKYLKKLREDKSVAEDRMKLEGERVKKQLTVAARYTKEYDRLCKEKDIFLGQYSKALDDERINDGNADFFATMLFPAMEVGGIVGTTLAAGALAPAAGATVLLSAKALDDERINDGNADLFATMLFPAMEVGGIVGTTLAAGALAPAAGATVLLSAKALDDERINDGNADLFATMLFPAMEVGGIVGTTLAAGALAPAAGATVLLSGIAIGLNVWNEDRKTKNKSDHTDKVADRMEKAEEKIQSTLEKQRQEEMHMLEYKEKQLAAIHEVEKLALEEDNAADVTGLINAHDGLGQVYAQLIRLTEFWGQIVVCIELINKETSAAYRYKNISALLRKKVEQAEMNWNTFIDVCDKYVRVCRNDDSASVKKLYEFLSEPMDSMTKDQRKERQAKIAEDLKRRVHELGSA